MKTLASQRYDVESFEDAVELYYRNGWTDGLPVIPPTPERVRAFVDAAGREPDEELGHYKERGRHVTVEKVAVNAVMAGCLPEYFPVVLAIVEVMLDPEIDFHAANASTGSPAIGFVVNGPIRNQIGMNYMGNFMGPGNRANATIGRAVRLTQINAFGSVGGAGHDEDSVREILDRGTMGQPAKYTGFHIPEYEEAFSELAPLHVERGFAREQNVVTVFATNGGMQISLHADQTAEQVVETVAHQLVHVGRNTTYDWLVLVLTPEVARILVRDGWSKARFREALYEKGKRSAAWLKQNNWSITGFYKGGRGNPPLQPGDESRMLSVAGGPDQIYLVVAGSLGGGWGYFLHSYGPIGSKAF